MKFVDKTLIYAKAGDGGPGMSSFRAAPGRPKLGPDGGNGGPGGDVILEASPSVSTLAALRYKQWYKAEHGGQGHTNNKTGAVGDNKLQRVPLGTVVYDADTGEWIGELLEEGDRLVVAKGGKRGYGNLHFVSATHQAPQECTPGEPGETRNLRLELKLLADVGLAGFPNAGKSTLLSRMSSAKPKIADYPFTTLIPNLGVVDLGDYGDHDSSYVIADVPGLIEGAGDGKGLGHEFLRHLDRTKVVAYVLDGYPIDETDPREHLEILKKELKKYSLELFTKRSFVVINKIDLKQDEESLQKLVDDLKEDGTEVLLISAVSGEGIKELKIRLYEILNEEKERLAKRS